MKQHMVCPHCKKEGYTRDGWYSASTRRGRDACVQYASGGFQDNLGFEYRQVLHLFITLALMLSGMVAANIQMTLRHLGMEVHVYTMTRTLEHYSGVADEHIRTVKLADAHTERRIRGVMYRECPTL